MSTWIYLLQHTHQRLSWSSRQHDVHCTLQNVWDLICQSIFWRGGNFFSYCIDLNTYCGPFRGLWTLVEVFNGHNYATPHTKAHEYAFCNDFKFWYHDRWDFELGELVVIPALWLRWKCHFASRKDILQKGARNTFNFLHFCPVST